LLNCPSTVAIAFALKYLLERETERKLFSIKSGYEPLKSENEL